MDADQSLEEEIRHTILNGNFSRSLQICQQWLETLSVQSLHERDEEYIKVQEAFFYSRFFLHRQERIGQLPRDAERARLFLNFFKEIENLRKEKNFVANDSPIYLALSNYMHHQIAESLAKAFAGQRAYDLNQDELLQLARSLIEIHNWKAALDTLHFIGQYSRRNPELLLLLAVVHYKLEDKEKFEINFREALLVKPEILEDYIHFIPAGNFLRLWNKLQEQGYPSPLIFRSYAMLAEVNGLYSYLRQLSKHEAEKLERDFIDLHQQYQKRKQEQLFARVLQLLVWLIIHFFRQEKEEETFDQFKAIFYQLDPHLWENFEQQVLQKLNKE